MLEIVIPKEKRRMKLVCERISVQERRWMSWDVLAAIGAKSRRFDSDEVSTPRGPTNSSSVPECGIFTVRVSS